jgi:hypothetical protein
LAFLEDFDKEKDRIKLFLARKERHRVNVVRGRENKLFFEAISELLVPI